MLLGKAQEPVFPVKRELEFLTGVPVNYLNDVSYNLAWEDDVIG